METPKMMHLDDGATISPSSAVIIPGVEVKFKKLHPDARVPERHTDLAAAVDLSCITDEIVTINPGDKHIFRTGLSVEFPPGFVMLIVPRSGLGIKQQVVLANLVGVIDADYRGEIMIALTNMGTESVWLGGGDRIAQAMFMPVFPPIFTEVNELSETDRGEGGLGSTGR